MFTRRIRANGDRVLTTPRGWTWSIKPDGTRSEVDPDGVEVKPYNLFTVETFWSKWETAQAGE